MTGKWSDIVYAGFFIGAGLWVWQLVMGFVMSIWARVRGVGRAPVTGQGAQNPQGNY